MNPQEREKLGKALVQWAEQQPKPEPKGPSLLGQWLKFKLIVIVISIPLLIIGAWLFA